VNGKGRRAKQAHLLEQASLLNDISDGLHSHAFCFVDIFEGVQVACLLVLNDANLGEVFGW
jgi:hypothetical protein